MIEIEPLLGLRMIADGSLSLISTRLEEKTNVATVSWQTPLSQNPVLLGVSLTPSSCTSRYLAQTGEFALCIPDVSLIAEVHFCGTHHGHSYDKLRIMELQSIRARKVSPLLIKNCIGYLECVVRERQHQGDHLFYIGEVVTALVEQDLFDNGWNLEAQTLHHLGGSLYQSGGQIVDALRFTLPGQHPPTDGESLFEKPADRFTLE
jgi:flavin reductase (DIM6/NTAB) family NADH-FMN oxidoreductase RutF